MTTQNIEAHIKELFAGSVPLDKIEVTENTRRLFESEQMKELTENVRHNGVLVPIIVVENGKPGTYRLVAGERRVRAAKAVGLKEILARVVEADEQTQVKIRLIENLHRAGLGPIEEAQGFKRFMDEGKHTLDGLAKCVDKSVKYVTRSVRLLELPKSAMKAIEKGIITPEHGHQILRAPEDKREKLTEYALAPKWGGVLPTIHDLTHEIEQRLERNLSRACFPKDQEYAGVMACAACPFNTGNQNVLFEGAQEGKCTDGGCFTKKSNQFLREFRDKAATHFEGLKFAGMASDQGYGGVSAIKGSVVLRPEELKTDKVKALIKAEPAKFRFGVIKPSSFGSKTTPTAVVVCTDKALLEQQIRKPTEQRHPAMTQEEQARERYLQGVEVGALFDAAAKTVKAIKKQHLVDVVLGLNGNENAFAAIGVAPTDDLRKELSKLSEKDLLRLAWLCSVDGWQPDEEFAAIGVDVKKVRKEARAEALAELAKAEKAKTQEKEKEVAAAKA